MCGSNKKRGKFSGQGHTLGGNGAQDPTDARRAAAEAAERRARAAGGSGKARTQGARSGGARAARTGGGGGSGGGSGAGGGSTGSREARANAAQQRIAANANLSAEKIAELDERRAKDDLIGQIRAICVSRHMDEPFGLPAASVPALKRHLAKLRETNA